MDDVLPKPFTKEGLLQMLEKHLQHLKKVNDVSGNADAMGPPQSASTMSHRSAGQSLKDESSPSGSPNTVTNNWNSSAQFGNINPATSGAFAAQQMQGGPMAQPGYHMGGQINMAGGAGPLAGHRRQISDMTGGPDDMSDPKRQRMFPQQQGGQMQGGPVGNPMQQMPMGRGPTG